MTPAYEEEGHDYPLGLSVGRPQRNFEAVLALLVMGRFGRDVSYSPSFPAGAGSKKRISFLGAGTASLGIILQYPRVTRASHTPETIVLPAAFSDNPSGSPAVPRTWRDRGRNYATHVLLPACRGHRYISNPLLPVVA